MAKTIASRLALATATLACLAAVGAGGSWGARAERYDPSADSNSMLSTTAYTGAQAWWKAGYTGKGIDVAVIDSGVAPVRGLDGPNKVVRVPDGIVRWVFDHVTIRVTDRAASERFYDTVLATLGIEKTHSGDDFPEWNDFSLSQAAQDGLVTRRLHVAFVAPSQAHVDEFWRVGTEAGYPDEGSPGPRPQYREDYYGSFLLDPDGNSVEAVHHGAMSGGGIDHLWLRTGDVAAARRFYETIAPHAGLRLRRVAPEWVQFVGAEGSFSFVPGTPTEHVHMAFPAGDNETVDAFHRTATEAGYRDNGSPGERPVYHQGYYGAYVLDPDGHNVEVVNHNRP